MDFTICVDLLLLVFLLVSFILVPAKLKQMRGKLTESYELVVLIQAKLDGAKREIVDLEWTLLEASEEIDILNAEAEMEGPDM